MASLQIEHVNLTVSDPERSARLFEDLFDWKVRWRGAAINDGVSVHVGGSDHYLALYRRASEPYPNSGFAKGTPLNHIGVLVDDLEATEAKVIAAGLRAFNHDDYEPGRRFYFLDPDGIEFEVVAYSK